MDGVAGLNQKPIAVGETFVYEFTLEHPGTFMYHPHFDEMTQIALGMVGMFIVHPKRPRGPRVDRDFALHDARVAARRRRAAARPERDDRLQRAHLQQQGVPRHGSRWSSGEGERVRIRFGNLSPMDHHPIHLHGLTFEMTATDGGYVPESAQ